MYLSPREKQLLAEFLSIPSPVSIQKMMNLLKVSKRTIYRELDNLEVSLQLEAHLSLRHQKKY